MKNHDLYQTIFKRKSIRKFKMDSLPEATLDSIKEYATQIKELFPIKIELEYLNTKKIKSLLAIKAPHYLLLYSEKKDNYLLNAGFILEQLDLYLSASGIGACWLGMAKPSEEILSKDGLEFVIMLAFGAPAEPLHRQNVSEFKRKTVPKISNCMEGNDLIEAIRLAPSASNGQPWYLQLNESELVLSREKLNLFKVKLLGKMNQIDMGIACAFADVILRQQGKNPNFYVASDENKQIKDGYEYVITSKWDE